MMYKPQIFGSEDPTNRQFDSNSRTVQVVRDPGYFIDKLTALNTKGDVGINDKLVTLKNVPDLGSWSVAVSTGKNLQEELVFDLIIACFTHFVNPDTPGTTPDYEWTGVVFDPAAARYCLSLTTKDSNEAQEAWKRALEIFFGATKSRVTVNTFRQSLRAAMFTAPGSRPYGFVYDPSRLEPSAKVKSGLANFKQLTGIDLKLRGDGFIAHGSDSEPVLRFLSWAAAMQVAYGFKSQDDIESLDAQTSSVLSRVRDIVDDSRFLSHYRGSSPRADAVKRGLAQPNNLRNMDLSLDGGMDNSDIGWMEMVGLLVRNWRAAIAMDDTVPFSESAPLVHTYPPDAGYFVYSRNSFASYINVNVGSVDCRAALLRWAASVLRQHPNSGFEGRILLDPGLCDLIMSTLLADNSKIASAFPLGVRTAYMIDVESVLPLLESFARHDEGPAEGGQDLIRLVNMARVSEQGLRGAMQEMPWLASDAAELFAIARSYQASHSKNVMGRIVRAWHQFIDVQDPGIKAVVVALEGNENAMKALYGGVSPKVAWFREFGDGGASVKYDDLHAYTVAVVARTVPMHQARALALATDGARRLSVASSVVSKASLAGATAPQAVESFYTAVPEVPLPPVLAPTAPAQAALPSQLGAADAADGGIIKFTAVNKNVPVPLVMDTKVIKVGSKEQTFPMYNHRREYTSPDTGQTYYFAGEVQALRMASMPSVNGVDPNDVMQGKNAVVARMEKSLQDVLSISVRMNDPDATMFTDVGSDPPKVVQPIKNALADKRDVLRIEGINTNILNNHVHRLLQRELKKNKVNADDPNETGDQVYSFFDRIELSGSAVKPNVVGSGRVAYPSIRNAVAGAGILPQRDMPATTYTAIDDSNHPVKKNVAYLIGDKAYKIDATGTKLVPIPMGSDEWKEVVTKTSPVNGLNDNLDTGDMNGSDDDSKLISELANERVPKLRAEDAIIVTNDDSDKNNIVEAMKNDEIYRDSNDVYLWKHDGKVYRLIVYPNTPIPIKIDKFELAGDYSKYSVGIHLYNMSEFGSTYKEWAKSTNANVVDLETEIDDEFLFYMGKIGKTASAVKEFVESAVAYSDTFDQRFVYEATKTSENYMFSNITKRLISSGGETSVYDFLISEYPGALDPEVFESTDSSDAVTMFILKQIQDPIKEQRCVVLSGYSSYDIIVLQDAQERLKNMNEADTSNEIDPKAIKSRMYQYKYDDGEWEDMFSGDRPLLVLLKSENRRGMYNLYRITTEKFDLSRMNATNTNTFERAEISLRTHGAYGVPFFTDATYEECMGKITENQNAGKMRQCGDIVKFSADDTIDRVVKKIMKQVILKKNIYKSGVSKKYASVRAVFSKNGMCMPMTDDSAFIFSNSLSSEDFILSNYSMNLSYNFLDTEFLLKDNVLDAIVLNGLTSKEVLQDLFKDSDLRTNYCIKFNDKNSNEKVAYIYYTGTDWGILPKTVFEGTNKTALGSFRLDDFDSKSGREALKQIQAMAVYGNDASKSFYKTNGTQLNNKQSYLEYIKTSMPIQKNNKTSKLLGLYANDRPRWYRVDDAPNFINIDNSINLFNNKGLVHVYTHETASYYAKPISMESLKSDVEYEEKNDNLLVEDNERVKFQKYHARIVASLLAVDDNSSLADEIFEEFKDNDPAGLLKKDFLNKIVEVAKKSQEPISNARVENNGLFFSVGTNEYSVYPYSDSPVVRYVGGANKGEEAGQISEPLRKDSAFLDAKGYSQASVRPRVGQFVYILPKGMVDEYVGGNVTAVRGNHIYVGKHSCNGFKNGKVYVVDDAPELQHAEVEGVGNDDGKVVFCKRNKQAWVYNTNSWACADLSRGSVALDKRITYYAEGETVPPSDDSVVLAATVSITQFENPTAISNSLIDLPDLKDILEEGTRALESSIRKTRMVPGKLYAPVGVAQTALNAVEYVVVRGSSDSPVYHTVSSPGVVAKVGDAIAFVEWQDASNMHSWTEALDATGRELVLPDSLGTDKKLLAALDAIDGKKDASEANYQNGTVYYTGTPDNVFFVKRKSKDGNDELRRVKYTPGYKTTHGKYDMSKKGSIVKKYDYLSEFTSEKIGDADLTVAQRVNAMNIIMARIASQGQ